MAKTPKTWRIDWETNRYYRVGDLVMKDGYQIECQIAHTSGTYATDVSSGYWQMAYPMKNWVINGNFDFAQRGTSSGVMNGGSTYQVDRFFAATGGGGATNNNTVYSQQAVTNLSGSQQCHRVVSGTGIDGSPSPGIGTAIETRDTIQLINKVVTISCYVRIVTGSEVGTLGLSLKSSTSIDTKLTAIDAALASISISESLLSTTTWTKLIITTTIPSNCKTISLFVGENQHSSHGVAGRGFEIAQIMLNEGPAPAAFQTAAPNIQAELAMCQRYYQNLPTGSFGGILGQVQSATTAICYYTHLVELRNNTYSFTQSGTWDWTVAGGTNTCSFSSIAKGTKISQLEFTVTGQTIGQAGRVRNGTLAFDAEL